jgi:hypothetical protein
LAPVAAGTAAAIILTLSEGALTTPHQAGVMRMMTPFLCPETHSVRVR